MRAIRMDEWRASVRGRGPGAAKPAPETVAALFADEGEQIGVDDILSLIHI